MPYLFLALVGLIVCLGTIPVNKIYDNSVYRANKKAAIEKLESIQNSYQQPFYLKEMNSEPGIEGKIEGSFIFVCGEIYGQISSGRVINLIYEDNDTIIDDYTGVCRAISFPLDKAVIVTIDKGQRPYLTYPEAKISDGCCNEITLNPGNPHLYLPEGWKIL